MAVPVPAADGAAGLAFAEALGFGRAKGLREGLRDGGLVTGHRLGQRSGGGLAATGEMLLALAGLAAEITFVRIDDGKQKLGAYLEEFSSQLEALVG